MRGQAVRTPEKVAEAQRLRAEGKLLREIGEHFGISVKTAHAWLADPDGSALRERHRKLDMACVVCGGRADGANRYRMPNPDEPVCASCAGEHYAIWTSDAIALCIEEWADEHGGIPPSATAFQRAKVRGEPVPTVNNVIKRFGSWNAAIRAAGFEPRGPGDRLDRGPYGADQRAAAVRRYASGESSVVIAADLDCSPQIVTRWARAAGVPIRGAWGKAA